MTIKTIITTLALSLSLFACSSEENTPDPVDDNAALACNEGQTCPLGSLCNGTFCEGTGTSDEIPQACGEFDTEPGETSPEDNFDECGAGLECVDGECQYPLEGSACTAENAAETCGDIAYCKFEIEDACGVNGEQGVCSVEINDALSDQGQVVCGCDGETYWNAEAAAFYHTSVAYIGTCDNPNI